MLEGANVALFIEVLCRRDRFIVHACAVVDDSCDEADRPKRAESTHRKSVLECRPPRKKNIRFPLVVELNATGGRALLRLLCPRHCVGRFSDPTLASDAHLHTCAAGTRGLIIVPYSRQHRMDADRIAVDRSASADCTTHLRTAHREVEARCMIAKALSHVCIS